MGTFKSTKTFYASAAMIPGIAKEIETEFANEGFMVQSQPLIGGGYDISLSKGGSFKAVLGMKSALKVNIQPQGNTIFIEAGVGIFGQQAIPTVISMLFLWPVLLTQIWGMVQQSKLDERVMNIAERHIARNSFVQPPPVSQSQGRFCTSCGTSQPTESNFCSRCGNRMG